MTQSTRKGGKEGRGGGGGERGYGGRKRPIWQNEKVRMVWWKRELRKRSRKKVRDAGGNAITGSQGVKEAINVTESRGYGGVGMQSRNEAILEGSVGDTVGDS